MNFNKHKLLFALLVLILLFRIQSQGGIEKPVGQDPELEQVASHLTPFRDFLASQFNGYLPQPQAALLSGILLGVKSDLSSDFSNSLRRTSTIHIVVVSGQNLTLLVGVLMSFVHIFGRKKMILLALFSIVCYSVLTGLQIPVIRAAIMVSLGLVAMFFGRESDSGWVLLTTALGMLIFRPDWILSISFQLSFVATVGVVIVAPVIVKSLNFIPELLKENLGVSIAAQAMTWPIIAANFHQVSVVGVVVNTLILWTISIIMVTGIFALIAIFLNPWIGFVLSLIPGVLLTYFIYIVEFFDKLPLASLYVSKTSPMVWIGYYILILGLYLYLKAKVGKTTPIISSVFT